MRYNPDALTIFGLRWHVDLVGSPAMKLVLAEPLKSYIDVLPAVFEADTIHKIPQEQPLIFFDKAPDDRLLTETETPVVWIPMYDGHTRHGSAWWERYRGRKIKFVAYSETLRKTLVDAGLDVFSLKFFSAQSRTVAFDWGGQHKAFYWNRSGLLTVRQLESLCSTLRIRTLYYRARTNSSAPSAVNYQLPAHLGSTEVVTVPFMNHQDYLSILNECHFFVAPRPYEGIGLTFLEAMANGAVVFASSMPTMSEYIIDGKTGVLMAFSRLAYLAGRAEAKFEKRTGVSIPIHAPPMVHIDWDRAGEYDMPSIGRAARREAAEGRAKFMAQIPDLLEFMLNW